MKTYITLGIIAFLILIGLSSGCNSYKKMVSLDEGVSGSWSQVENVYQRRADLIPSLINTVQGAADFEKSTLTDVIEARANASSMKIDPSNLTPEMIQQFQSNQGALTQALSRLMVVVERYPELKANQNFLELQAQLEGTENRIAVEREKFTRITEDYNKYIRMPPQVFYAGFFGFEKRPYFEAEKGSEKPPQVKFNFKN
jgi:LemA protein